MVDMIMSIKAMIITPIMIVVVVMDITTKIAIIELNVKYFHASSAAQ